MMIPEAGRGRSRRRDSPAPSTIHVYNWDGVLEKVIELDLGVTAIAVVDDGATLYGATYEDGFAEVAVWRLGEGVS